MKIGFLDSGIGGLSVLEEARKALPKEQFIFYADRDHVPYGEKSEEEVIGYVTEAVQFMLERGAKDIVVACNTATSVAINQLRKDYTIPIIGMEPAVKKAIDLYGDKRVLVAATPITVRGEKMKCLIERVDKQHLVDLVPLPRLVRFAEQGIFCSKEVEEYLREEFQQFDYPEYASLVLGCTHFNYFKECFRKVLPRNIHFVDGNEGTINHLRDELEEFHLLEENEQTVEYYYSGKQVTEEAELDKLQRYQEHLERMKTLR